MKCSSLFDYCVRELGYSEGAAQRRIVAARMLTEIPEIEKKIATGSLTLSNISQVNQFYRETTTAEKREALASIEGMTKKACEKKLFELTGKEEIVAESEQRVSKDKVKVAYVLNDETMELLKKLKGLLGGNLEMDQLLQYALKAGIAKVEKDKFKQTESVRKVLSPAKVSRVITASVKRDVYRRDRKCVNCGSVYNLNFDHAKAYALGGDANTGNIRLLCFNCNQRASIRQKFSSA